MPVYLQETYQNDIMFSYALVDDAPLMGAQASWIMTFVKNLKTTLAQKLTTDRFAVWTPRQASGNRALQIQINEQINHSALFVIILSSAYLETEQPQLQQILAQASPESGRLFIVEYQALEQEVEALNTLGCYRFWILDSAERPRTLGIPQPTEIEYYYQLDNLAYDLSNKLKVLRKDLDEPRLLAFKLLNTLSPRQFQEVLLFYNVPREHLTEGDQHQQAIEVTQYALQKEGEQLAELMQLIHQVMGKKPVGHDTDEPRFLAFKLLKNLLPSQFQEVVWLYNAPHEHLTEHDQQQQAIELIEYALQKEDQQLTELIKVIHQVNP